MNFISYKQTEAILGLRKLKRQGLMFFYHLSSKPQKRMAGFGILRPLFPMYLFMSTSIDPVPWKSVNGTRGVAKAVTFDGIFRPINTRIIEGLQQRCNENGVVQHLGDIGLGDLVKIERGPFAEFICTVDQIKNDKRVLVLIDILQQQTKAEVFVDEVSKIN